MRLVVSVRLGRCGLTLIGEEVVCLSVCLSRCVWSGRVLTLSGEEVVCLSVCLSV